MVKLPPCIVSQYVHWHVKERQYQGMLANVSHLIRGHLTKPELFPDIAKKERKHGALNLIAINFMNIFVPCFCI